MEWSSESERDDNDDDDDNYYPSSSDHEGPPKKKLKRSTIEKLDSAGLSFRQMNKVAEAFIEEFGENPKDYCIASSTFHSNTTKLRHEFVTDMSQLIQNENSKLVLLYDTKSFNQINAAHLRREKRLATVLHGACSHYGLGINVVADGRAETLSDELISLVDEFNLRNRIVGLVCDTENTNTGYYGGACTKFEMKIEKDLLRLCCRHHIMELVLKEVCIQVLGDNSTPEFSFDGSEQLIYRWKQINKNNYRPIDQDEFGALPVIQALRDQAVDQITNDGFNNDVREDYAELNDLCLKLMGVRTPKGIRVVGALSKARWMSKAILIAKTYLLRDSLDLEDDISDALKRICIYICLIYVKFWNRTPCTIDAPANDLLFIQQLYLFKQVDEEIAQAAINKFKDHLWYLGEELTTLALFSDHVPVSTKNKMRARIRDGETIRVESSLRFIMDDNTDFASIGLEEFVGRRSNFLFQLFETWPDFIDRDAATWDYVESFKEMKKVINETIIGINDGAERILGAADKAIRSQKARKEKNFKNLVLSKFDKNARVQA